MNKNQRRKLILLNTIVASIYIAIFSNAIPLLSLTTFNLAVRALSITALICNTAFFFAGNRRIMIEGKGVPVKVLDTRSEDYIKTLKEYSARNSGLVDIIDKTENQIIEVYRNLEKHIEILERNDTKQDDLIRDGEKFKESVMHNIRIILNRLTILDGKKPDSQREEELYEENMQYISEILKTNEDILYKFDEMLILVSNMKGNYLKDNTELVSILSVLDSLYNIKYEN